MFRISDGKLERLEGGPTGWLRVLLRLGSSRWAAGDNGLFRIEGSRLMKVGGDRTGRVYALAGSPDGTLWVGAFNGLFTLEDGRTRRVEGDRPRGVLSLLQEGETLWIGALEGLFRLRGGDIAAVEGDETGWVGTLLERNGRLWLGAEKGLLHLRQGKTVRVETMGASGADRPESPPEAPSPSGPAD